MEHLKTLHPNLLSGKLRREHKKKLAQYKVYLSHLLRLNSLSTDLASDLEIQAVQRAITKLEAILAKKIITE